MVLHYKSLSDVTADIPNLHFFWKKFTFLGREELNPFYIQLPNVFPVAKLPLSVFLLLVLLVSIALRPWTSGGPGDMNSF